MLKKIKLRGSLGKKFGKEFLFEVESPAEAIKALCHQVKGFKAYMLDGEGKEQKFKIVVGKETLSDISKQINLNTENTISLVPVIRGAGGDVGKIIGGGLLVASVFGFGPLSGVFASAFLEAGAVATYGFLGVGGALVLSGTSNMLFKPPTMPAISEQDKNNDRSYLFNGAVNTIQQGQPIPVGYGRMRIGSQVVSAAVSTTQVPI